MALNCASVSGNLTSDAELRQTRGGLEVLTFSIAVNERRKSGDEWVDYPNYVDCTMFGTRAGKLAGYLAKGTKVAVSGRLHQDRWEDQQGNKRSKLGVTVNELEFMSRRDGQASTPSQDPELYDENIPF